MASLTELAKFVNGFVTNFSYKTDKFCGYQITLAP